MRLFVGLDVGPEVQRAAARVIDELRQRVERAASRARVSWVKPDRLHVTVRFIGDADEALYRDILAAFDRPLATSAFDLRVEGTGSFPPGRPPKVVWAGLTMGVEQVLAVEREIRSRLDPLPLERESRAYNPHLTLGRVKNPAGIRPAALLSGLEDVVFGTTRVEAVTLFESQLSSAGPAYLARGRTVLPHA